MQGLSAFVYEPVARLRGEVKMIEYMSVVGPLPVTLCRHVKKPTVMFCSKFRTHSPLSFQPWMTFPILKCSTAVDQRQKDVEKSSPTAVLPHPVRETWGITYFVRYDLSAFSKHRDHIERDM